MLHTAYHRAAILRHHPKHSSESASNGQETLWGGITSTKLHASIKLVTSFRGVLLGSVFQVHRPSNKVPGMAYPGMSGLRHHLDPHTTVTSAETAATSLGCYTAKPL